MESDRAEYFLKPLVDGWSRKIKAAIEFKKLHFPKDLSGALNHLGAPAPSFTHDSDWEGLSLTNNLRNAIVHHSATPTALGTVRGDWLKRLIALGVVNKRADTTWEQLVLCSNVAQWACLTVGEAIIRLETLPHGRRRALGTVVEALTPMISSLSKPAR